MLDKNGVEIKTGDVVRITGAYFRNDNGLWYVDNSPGDPTWSGNDYSLGRLQKNGKLSTARHNICFWPIMVCVNDRYKAAEAREWNNAHAEIEVVTDVPQVHIAEYFLKLGRNRGADRGGALALWRGGSGPA